jgi:hypothetical protein
LHFNKSIEFVNFYVPRCFAGGGYFHQHLEVAGLFTEEAAPVAPRFASLLFLPLFLSKLGRRWN